MPARRSARALWLRLHLALGLSIGVVFAVLGATGSLIVFDDELDALLNPDLLVSGAAERRIGADAAIAAARASLPAGESVAWLSWPDMPGGVFSAYAGPPGDPFARQVTVDPADATVLGSRRIESGVVNFVYDLHFQLQLGGGGQTVVGVAGLATLLSLGTGLYLWWPRRRHWRTGLTVRRRARAQRRVYDLHRVFGAFGLIPLLVAIGTGLFLALPGWTEPVVDAVTPVSERRGIVRSGGGDPAESTAPGRAVAVARDVLPRARVTGLGLPSGARGSYRVALREDAFPGDGSGRAYVWVDRFDARVLARERWSTMSTGDRFLAWPKPLHNGSAFGPAGRLVVFALGWLPLAMLVTGTLIWRFKRRAAGRVRHRRTVHAS